MVRAGALVLALGLSAMAASPASAQTVRQLPPGQSSDTPTRDKDAQRDRHVDTDSRADAARRDVPSIATRGLPRGGSSFDAKFESGMAAIRAKDPGKAVELMRPVLADFEQRYAGEKRQIYCAVTPEQSAAYRADATKASREAVTIEPDWCRAQYVTAFALIDLERYADATAALQRLVGFAPQSSRYLNELGYGLMKQKKLTESLDAYRRSEAAADLTPGRVKEERCIALKGMGYDLVELGDLNAAEAAYRKCLIVDPADKDSPGEIEYIQKQRKLTV
ncbi:MAG TPA: tetratricopeptide repeat protein [Sphingomonas sp.]|nr:tetratricopeptide repeat protein [Sphingomonas sp.]